MKSHSIWLSTDLCERCSLLAPILFSQNSWEDRFYNSSSGSLILRRRWTFIVSSWTVSLNLSLSRPSFSLLVVADAALLSMYLFQSLKPCCCLSKPSCCLASFFSLVFLSVSHKAWFWRWRQIWSVGAPQDPGYSSLKRVFATASLLLHPYCQVPHFSALHPNSKTEIHVGRWPFNFSRHAHAHQVETSFHRK